MAKVKSITVSNLKALSALSVDFNGCTGIITGGNNKGKSSFLKSLPERIRGNKPDVILKDGAKDGFAEWQLTTGEKFVWTFDGKKEKLTFISERNISGAVTKDLARYYFPPVFDVDEFLQSTPAKQKAVLQKLTGIDFTEIDLQFKEAYENRTFANRKLADEKAKTVPFDRKLPTVLTPTDDILKQIAGADAKNALVKNKVDLVNQKTKQVADNETDILQLKQRIESLHQKNSLINGELLELDCWIDENRPVSKEDMEHLKEDFELLNEKNKEIAENNKAIEQQAIYDKAVTNAEMADIEVKQIESIKLDVIKNASMPDGFGFDEEGITYNGFSFNKEQLSSSGIYIAALKLAAIGLGEVKTLHFDASYLDKNSLADIEKWAIDNDLQLLIERPDFEAGEITYEILNEE